MTSELKLLPRLFPSVGYLGSQNQTCPEDEQTPSDETDRHHAPSHMERFYQQMLPLLLVKPQQPSVITDPSSVISYEIQQGSKIAIIRINNTESNVNILDRKLIQELNDLFQELALDKIDECTIRGLVFISGKSDCFLAGSDLDRLAEVASQNVPKAGQPDETTETIYGLADYYQQFMSQLEQLRVPTVAAIQGCCYAGGLEFALACRSRVSANTDATFYAALEILLGLIPWAGGTQRLLRLVNLPDALRMLLAGCAVSPEAALKMGLVDRLIDVSEEYETENEQKSLELLEQAAIKRCNELINGSTELSENRKRPWSERLLNRALNVPGVRNRFLDRIKAQLELDFRHQIAPFKLLELIRAFFDSQPQTSESELEAATFAELLRSSQFQTAYRLYQALRHCKLNQYGSFAGQNLPETFAVVDENSIGSGIVLITDHHGVKRIVVDLDPNKIAEPIQRVDLDRFHHESDDPAHPHKLFPATDYANLRKVDLIMETVKQDVEGDSILKLKIMNELEPELRADCIYATLVTMSPIKELASQSARAGHLIGLHYFEHDVHRMPLMEVVRTDATEPDVLQAAVALGLHQNKLVLVVKDSPGFFVNRCLAPLLSEALLLLQEGVSPLELDRITAEAGFAIPIATFLDELGADFVYSLLEELRKVWPDRLSGGNLKLLEEMIGSDRLGREIGKGLFSYNLKTGRARPSVKAGKLLQKYAEKPQIENTPETIQNRLLTRLVNEAVRCLQEAVIDSHLTGDLGLVLGVGFPPHLGGPFQYVDQAGAAAIIAQMAELSGQYPGPRFEPCQLLLEHAENIDKRFYTTF